MAKKPVPKRKKQADSISAHGIDDEISLPTLPSDDEKLDAKNVIKDAFEYDVAYNFAFIGIGQAGARIASTFYDIGYRRVVVIDGAYQDLEDVRDDILKLDLGTSGAGKDIEQGAASVADKSEQIWNLLYQGVGTDPDYILVCASLGGGTGSGACPKVVEIAKEYMRKLEKPERVGCVVALPSNGEGQRLARNALTTFGRLRAAEPCPMIIIDNQRINELFPVGITKLYQKCNEQTAKLFHLFNQLSAQRSRLITFDRAEFASLLDQGIVVFGASEIGKYESPVDVSDAIRSHLAQTALAEVDLSTGQGAGCIFVASEETLDTVPMDVFAGGFDMLGRLLREGAIVHRGVYKGSSTQLRCFTLLAGLDPPAKRLGQLGEEARLPKSQMAAFLGVDDG